MENINTKILIGGFENRPVWAEIKVRDYNGYPELGMSFDEGLAFEISTIDEEYLKEYYKEYFNCCDDTSKLMFLNDGLYNLDEAIENAIDNTYDYRDIIDCSCTDYEVDVDDEIYNFQTICCGQYDIRTDEDYNNFIFTNKKAVLELLKMWDEYHCKKIDEKTYNELLNIINVLKKSEDEDFLKSLINEEEL